MSSARRWRSYGVCAGLVVLSASACGSKNDTKAPHGSYNGGDEDAGAGEGNGKAGSLGNGGHAGQGEGATDAGGTGPEDSGAGSGGDTGRGGATGGAGAAGGDGEGGAGAAGGGGEGGYTTTLSPGAGRTGALSFVITTPQRVAVPGQSMLWNVTVGNTSTVAVKGVNVLMRVPDGFQFVYTLANPAASGCGNSTCSATEEATWALGDLAPGMTNTIQIDGSVLNTVGEGDDLAPLFRLSATDLDPLTLTKSVPVHPNNAAELTLAASGDPLVAGDSVELAVDVGNVGVATLFTGQLSLTLPEALEVTSASDGGVASSGDGVAQVAWSFDSLPVGATARRFVQAKLRAGVLGGEILNPRVAFDYEDAPSDVSAEYPISVVAKAPPLLLEVVPAADPIVPGSGVLYDVIISNRSLRAVDGVNLWARVPPELSFIYTTNAEPDAAGCGNATCSDQELATWTLGTLDAGTSQVVTVNASVLGAAAGDGTLVSSAFEVRAVGVNPLHVQRTVGVHPMPPAQLALGTAVAPVTPGQTFTYDVDIGQIGAGSLVDGQLVLELPPAVTAGVASDGGIVSNGVVTWSLADIPVAGYAHRSVEVTVDAAAVAGSVLGARASVTFDGGQELDAVSELGTAVVSESLPLSVTLEASANPAKLGALVNYTTTIKNNSGRAVDGVQLLLRLPSSTSFTYTSADPDASACGNATCSEGEEAVWDLGSIAAGATKIVLAPPIPGATLVAGSLVTFKQRLTAVNLGGVIQLQTTLNTKQ